MSKAKVNKSTAAAPATKTPRVRKPAATKQVEATKPAEVVAPVATPAPAAPQQTDASNKRTIEKDRPEQNGVKQPSAGGMCRAVWDFCTSASASTLVTAAQVKEAAAAHNWNPNNAMIEYYQWRKFNGIRGRQAKPAAPAQAQA